MKISGNRGDKRWPQLLRLSLICLISSLISQSAVGISPAQAAPVSFSATGANVTAFDGDVPARNIGSLLLTKGSVTISGNTIEVNSVPDWMFDKKPVLSGVVIRSQLQNTADRATVSGLVYFSRGDWLPNLGRSRATEVVVTTDGSAFSGHVVGTTETALEMTLANGTRQTITFSKIESISSARSFTFSVPATAVKIQPADGSYQADAATISFTPALVRGGLTFVAQAPSVPKSTLPGTEGGISNTSLTAMVAADMVNMIAPIIASPIIFKGASLADKQLLQGAGNVSSGQPYYSGQVWANGSYHPFPFTYNSAVNQLIEQAGIKSGNPLF